jgi:hypothetical protein
VRNGRVSDGGGYNGVDWAAGTRPTGSCPPVVKVRSAQLPFLCVQLPKLKILSGNEFSYIPLFSFLSYLVCSMMMLLAHKTFDKRLVQRHFVRIRCGTHRLN